MDRVVLTGITHPGEFELSEGLLSIGRNPTNDYRIHDPTVSSFHCELVVSGSTVLVRDLNSTNGTFIDDEPIHESFLKSGQILRLGEAQLRFDAVPEQEEVVIQIPERATKTHETETHLLDGRLACLNHPGEAAVMKCTKCGHAYCANCVRPLGLEGGQKRLFCPHCSSPCESVIAAAPKRRTSFIGRLTETIRMIRR
jgi:hypothetical protein